MTVLQALDRYYGRMADRGDVVAPGWSNEPMGAVLELDSKGHLLDSYEWLNGTGRPKQERVPKWFSRSGTGSTPFFLWDNGAYVLGLGVKDPVKTARDHEAFKSLHISQLAGEDDPGLLALRRFLEQWIPDRGGAPNLTDKLLGMNLAFRLSGDRNLLHQRPAALSHIDQLRATNKSNVEAFCLVRGGRLPVVRLHPKIKGVDGTAAAEVPLVSFEGDAFRSYGKTQGFNAPTSEAAAFQYGAALNALLQRDSRNRLKIADATVVFWADASSVGEDAAKAAEDVFADLFTPPTETGNLDQDESEAAKLRDKLEEVAKGRPVSVLDSRLASETRFYVLGLAPNAARLSVRYWLEDTFDAFARRLAEHYRDLAIEPNPWRAKPPAIQRLLVKTTALKEKFDNIPPLLAGEVARAVLGGTPYPRTLIATAIVRLRAGDDPKTGWHAAVLRACINRAHRFAHPKVEEPLSVSLNPDTPSPAYQLGRLFSVLESAQYAALGRVNASIVDRYYGSASSTPARVFGALMRGAQTHISDAKKRGRGLWIESRLTEIVGRLPAALPTSLRIEDQARFAVGYYHERGSGQARAKALAETTEEPHAADVETDR
jgi:CRISPR-associated protein Csd1